MFVTPSLLSLVVLLHAPSAGRADASSKQASCDTAQLELRRMAMRALATNAPDRLPAVMSTLKKRTDRCSIALRLEILPMMKWPAAQDVVRDLAATDPDTIVRQHALEMLQADTTVIGLRVLGQVARGAPTLALRQQAVQVITQSRSPFAAQVLANLVVQ